MISMAFTAGGGVRRVALQGSPVYPFHKSFFGHIVADSAADFLELIFMWEIFNFGIHMAADTVQSCMG
jgi:hypothetical protein